MESRVPGNWHARFGKQHRGNTGHAVRPYADFTHSVTHQLANGESQTTSQLLAKLPALSGNPHGDAVLRLLLRLMIIFNFCALLRTVLVVA